MAIVIHVLGNRDCQLLAREKARPSESLARWHVSTSLQPDSASSVPALRRRQGTARPRRGCWWRGSGLSGARLATAKGPGASPGEARRGPLGVQGCRRPMAVAGPARAPAQGMALHQLAPTQPPSPGRPMPSRFTAQRPERTRIVEVFGGAPAVPQMLGFADIPRIHTAYLTLPSVDCPLSPAFPLDTCLLCHVGPRDLTNLP